MVAHAMNMDFLRLKKWFASEKRDLPWRQTQEPYAIWISEVMLQQTQVVTVIPYFLNWMKRFPSINHLANASTDEVIKAWEGLGYYSRARYLHEAAKIIVNVYNGEFPDNEEKLKIIKGMGPYTIGAILSFAFHQKKAAVDGNVVRVLTRHFEIVDDISKSATMKRLRQLAQEILPDEEPWIVNEALIELGATICQRKPRCGECPLKDTCLSFRNHSIDSIPCKSKKIKIERLNRSVAIVQCNSRFLVKKGKAGEIMRDLYEFPYFEISQPKSAFQESQNQLLQLYNLQAKQELILKEVSQSFTRYQVKLFPCLFSSSELKKIEGMEWLSFSSLKDLAFSSGHRKIFLQLCDLVRKNKIDKTEI